MKGEVSVVRLHEIAIATFVTLTLAVAAWADPQAQNSDSKHLGVKSCSGDNCHGAVKPAEHSAVMQNEYLIWSQETDKDRVDKHHRAYAVLGDERGIRIARNLGLPDAVTAEICLNCHADNVPETRRGPRFEISDGVGCETCHGAAEKWLGVHLSGAGHKANLDAGLYPTENPVARAEKCLSCHFGDPSDESRFVTHRLMGAGHPRLSSRSRTSTRSLSKSLSIRRRSLT